MGPLINADQHKKVLGYIQVASPLSLLPPPHTQTHTQWSHKTGMILHASACLCVPLACSTAFMRQVFQAILRRFSVCGPALKQTCGTQKGKAEGCRLLTGGGRVAGKSKGYWVQVQPPPPAFPAAAPHVHRVALRIPHAYQSFNQP